MIIERRSFLRGLGAAFAAPAIVKVSSLMPVRSLPLVLVSTEIEPSWGLKSPEEILAEVRAMLAESFQIPGRYLFTDAITVHPDVYARLCAEPKS